MKIRTDFVTNSSSSSFIIFKNCLTNEQIECLKKQDLISRKLNLPYCEDNDWKITETKDNIKGFTYLDNFDIKLLLQILGIEETDVQWDDYDCWDDE